jgi:Rrf2 family protein
MQVALGRKGDYSVRAVLHLARHYGRGRRKAREIASEMEIPRNYVPQILADLVRQGLLAATAGPAGGYELTRDPASITLLEVVEGAEGPVRAARCLLRGGPCDWENVCPLHEAWGAAEGALARELAATNFAALAAVDEQIERGSYREPVGDPGHRRPRRGRRADGA